MKNLTTANLDQMTTREDWLGFGYLGERNNQVDPQSANLVNAADAMLLDHANSLGLTEEELFDWANSKNGRWYGDCWFGCNGRFAEKYLPSI